MFVTNTHTPRALAVVLELPLGRLGSVLLAAGGGMGELEKEGVRLIHVSATARSVHGADGPTLRCAVFGSNWLTSGGV
eukprot:1404000-Rhodomonas_salina.3